MLVSFLNIAKPNGVKSLVLTAAVHIGMQMSASCKIIFIDEYDL